MLTRCPACSTVFRLSTDQLASRHGRVRCGNCSRVFSALDHLVVQPADIDSDTNSTAQSYDLFTDSTDLHSRSPEEQGQASAAGGAGEVQAYAGSASANEQPAQAVAAPIVPPVTLSLLSESRPRRTWTAVVGCCLAVVALAVQGVWFHKDRIAAQFPESRVLLEAACERLGCRVDVPLDAQSISIESSDLQADPATRNLLALSAIVRNRAGFSQPAPHLELALTDAQEAALVRKVLTPADYAPGVQTIDAGAEVVVKVWIDALQVRASGYRLYAFYP
ncbi:MAG: zinc-ribbon domain-containing protein [Burkholderiales bacterium]|nr:zinc-ribbon domain-containing protein [Burkholderiales bacterium]